jgi:ABC-type oligopeptide transport system substrate-binding subunit
MKKLLALVLGLVAVFALVACTEVTTTTTTTTTPPTTTTTTTTQPPVEVTGATGYFNLKYADSEVKLSMLGAVERYLISKNVSIPMFNNSGAVLYSSRVDLFSDTYVYLMGFGTLYSTLTAPDTGTTDKFTYRTSSTASPTTLNPLAYAGSPDSDVLSLALGSLYGFYFNDTKDGYVLRPSMATETVLLDAAVDETSGKVMAKNFKITIREDLYFYDKNGNVLDANPQVPGVNAMTAADFLYTFKETLDPLLKQRRYNVFTATLKVKNAQEYYSGTVTDFSQVGFAPVSGDPYSFTVELVNPLTEWDFMYNFGSFIITPVYRPIWEATKAPDGKSTTYGSDEDKFASHGPFILTNWEADKVVELMKNNNYHEKALYHYTNYRITRVADANAALLLFNNGELDVVGIPAANYDQYKDNPGLKKVPGATVFRASVNTMTQEVYDELVTAGKLVAGWTLKPILQVAQFREALYYAVDRYELAVTVAKTSTPDQTYISSAYAADPLTGAIYRQSEAGLAVLNGLNPETYGFNKAKAKVLYQTALDVLVAQGKLNLATPTVIKLEYATFTGATQLAIGNALKAQLELVFNDLDAKYSNITFELTVNQIASSNGMGVYYDKQMIGHFDLAISGISGGTLDPWGLLDVWCSDNRGGLFLLWGFDSTVVDLEWDGKLWSFDSLVMAAITGSYVIDGNEVSQAEYEAYTAGNDVDFAIFQALAELDKAYAKYDPLYFSEDALEDYDDAYDAAVLAIEAATTVAGVEAALTAGVAALEAVPRKAAALFEAQFAALSELDSKADWYYDYYNPNKAFGGAFYGAIEDFVYVELWDAILAATTVAQVNAIMATYLPGVQAITYEYYYKFNVAKVDTAVNGLVTYLTALGGYQGQIDLAKVIGMYAKANINAVTTPAVYTAKVISNADIVAALKVATDYVADVKYAVAAREAYEDLSAAQQALVDTTKLVAAETRIATLQVTAVIAQIGRVPATVTLANKTVIVALRAGYDALSVAQQALITNLADLVADEAAIVVLEVAASAARVAAVEAAITALPATPVLANKAAVVSARAAYTALSEAEQAEVDNLATLVAKEQAISDLEVAAVEALITALPALVDVKLTDQAAVAAARAAFNLLTADQKLEVANSAKLVSLELAIADLVAAKAVQDLIG